MRIGLSACLVAALMVSSSAAIAQSKPLPIPKVMAEQAQLRLELEGGSGRASKVSPATRTDLLQRQQELLAMLDGVKSSSDLSEVQEGFMRDTLAFIEAAVEGDDEERVVCKREKPLGSNMITRTCRTVKQMRLDQEYARAAVMEASRK